MCNIIRKEGFDFAFDSSACKECGGKCCTGEAGYIYVDFDEIQSISDYIKVPIEIFKLDYLKKVKYKYSIKEVLINGSWECLFFDKDVGCTIYEVRPKQCVSYPFWDFVKNNLEKERENCPGII